MKGTYQYEFADPDGHRVRIYFETSKYQGRVGLDEPRVDACRVRRQAGMGRPAAVDVPHVGTPGTGAPEESVTSDWPSAAGLSASAGPAPRDMPGDAP
jgi:hypothetical protein